ncbi:MAG: glycoside hydrolase family 2 protein [Frankiales bacterium]|nr:glycoside hydrolase family 2 protein [Frankiales bacterium]
MLGPWELVADDGSVRPVVVPGTVTQAFRDADLDDRTWVFRSTVLDVPPDPVLAIGGVATSYEVVVDGTVLVTCRSMYTCHRLPVSVRVGSVVEIRCLPLATAMPAGKPPRARWRTRLVDDGSLRLVRTTLLGRCPGIAPGPPVVGPWRPVTLESARPVLGVRTSMDGTTGVLTSSSDLELTCAGVTGVGELRIPDVDRWWPHTHGEPVLHDVTVGGEVVARVGFRTLHNADSTSLDLVVNDVRVWARGAVWTPPGLLAGVPEDPRATVQLAVDAGMNLLRVPGLAPYESAEFFAVCDELGVMVWHDLSLANLDVPHDLLGLDDELADLLDTAGGHPSLVVVCGGSETAQQVAMLALDPMLWETGFLRDRAPVAVGDQAVWVANSPVGGALPFRVGAGVAHWFGVGGYRRPLSDVRTSAVLFASECLAFANPSRRGDWVPRDNGSDWDFADVVDHYAAELGKPRDEVVGDLMQHVFADWRRAASPNRGGLVLWLRDLQPGHGWGVVEHDGTPKPPYHRLATILAARAVWFTDEGLDGVAVHAANDRPTPWTGELRLSFWTPVGALLEEVRLALTVPAHGSWTSDVEGLLGRFVDASYAFRFGPPEVGRITAEVDGVTQATFTATFPAASST